MNNREKEDTLDLKRQIAVFILLIGMTVVSYLCGFKNGSFEGSAVNQNVIEERAGKEIDKGITTAEHKRIHYIIFGEQQEE